MSYLTYDPTRRVPFASAPSMYARCEYHWWVKNTGQPSELYMSGVLQPAETETGSFSLDLPTVWSRIQSTAAVKIGLIDVTGFHSDIIKDVITTIDPRAVVTLYSSIRYYDPVSVALAVNQAVAAGNTILVMPFGQAAPDAGLKTALTQASQKNVAVVCSLPNTPQDCDVIADYPYSYGLPNVIGVNGVERQGNHYWSGHGSRAVAAPCRNIVGASLYTSGTSYAGPMVAALLGLMQKEQPGSEHRFYLNQIRLTADKVGNANRINTAKLFPTTMAA